MPSSIEILELSVFQLPFVQGVYFQDEAGFLNLYKLNALLSNDFFKLALIV